MFGTNKMMWDCVGWVQCLRRWRDERDKIQLYNAGKYGSAMVAVAIKLKYATQETTAWLVLFIFFSCLATLYQLYWDLVVDWGLLDRESKNPWLRDSLILKRKYIYFVSMVRHPTPQYCKHCSLKLGILERMILRKSQ